MGRHKKRSQPRVLSSSNDAGIAEGKGIAFVKCISDRLEALHLCASRDEYSSVSEAIAASTPTDKNPSEEDLENATTSLLEYFDEVSGEEANTLVYSAAIEAWGADLEHSTPLSNNVDESGCNESHIDDDDYGDIGNDGDFIGEGECELCERSLKLTRHHLIPKSTWPRMKTRLLNVADVIESLHVMSSGKNEAKITPRQQLVVDEKKKILQVKLGTADLSSLPVTITRNTVRAHLCQACLLCRMCHSAIHRIHSEWQLAIEYNTMDRLLECEEVLKFGRWANKQRPGSKM